MKLNTDLKKLIKGLNKKGVNWVLTTGNIKEIRKGE